MFLDLLDKRKKCFCEIVSISANKESRGVKMVGGSSLHGHRNPCGKTCILATNGNSKSA